MRAAALVVAALLLVAADAVEEPRDVVGFSEHGSVLGPMERHKEPDDPEAALGTFLAGLEAMGEARYEDAAKLFDRLAESTGWPEAAYNAALAWYAHGAYDVALQRADRVAEVLPDDVGAMYLRGVLLQAIGRHEDAVAVIEQSLARSRELGRRVDEAVGLLNLGASSRLLGRPDDALRHYRAARDLGGELGLTTIVAASWMGEGNVHLATGDRAAADAALASARRLGKTKGFGAAAADADLSLAAVALAEGKPDRARRLLEGAAKEISELPVDSMRASMLLTVAQLQRELGEREAAQVSLDESMRLFDRAGIEVGRAHALQYQGAWAMADGELDRADRLLESARAIQESFQVPLALAETWKHLADLRLRQGRLDEALAFAEQAVGTLAGAGAVEAERGALVVLASIRAARDELGAAREAAERAVELAERVGDVHEAHLVRSELAIIEAAAGNLDAARAHVAAVPKAAWAALPARQRARVALQLAWSLHRAGDLAGAEAEGRRALGIATGDEAAAPAGAEARGGGGADGGAPDGSPGSVSSSGLADLAASAREVVVFALLDAGRSEDADAFLAEQSIAGGELSDAVGRRRRVDAFNAGVDAYEAGDLPGAIAHFESVWADPDAAEDHRASAGKALAGALRGHGHALRDGGDLPGAAAAFERSASVAAELGDVAAEARARVHQASVHAAAGDPARAGALASDAAALATGAGDRALAGECWTIAGQSLFEVDAAASRTAFLRALEAWGTTPESLGSRASVTYNLAVLEFNGGSGADAKVRLEEAKVLAGQAGDGALVQQIDDLLAAIAEQEAG